ncbi:MAG TPA: pitrilysin family protein [Flavisolibacter sp.]|nr:pitrilysin family protein [Flavisolibacter sp.]
MKNISAIIFLIVCPLVLLAQNTKPYEMNISGVKIIVQPSGNEIVEVLTIFRGGVQNYPADKAGIEYLAMRALTECGTLKDDKNTFKNKLDQVSAQMGGSTGMDYSSFRMNCIKGDFEKVWPLYVEAMTIPRFDVKEFERIRQNTITGLRAEESDPDKSISKLARQTAFAGNPYAKEPFGTTETVAKITVDQAKKHYQSIRNKGRMLMVIVGELDKQQLEQKLKAFFAKVPSGTPFVTKKESYNPSAHSIITQEKELSTNYIQGITGAPLPGTPDYNAFVLAMRIFYTKHFLEVRSKHGISYAPATWFAGGLVPYSNFYVTTTEPNKYIAIARQLIDSVKKNGFSEAELKNQKAGYVTGLYYMQETNSAQAAAFASNEIIHGNWRRVLNLKEDMKKVTVADLNRAFNKYVSNITWVYQGNPKHIEPTLYSQKETPEMPKETKTF